MTLGERQRLFSKLLGQLLVWIYEQGWEVSMSEGYVGDTDARDGDYDGPHKKGGLHYKRLAQDINLFVDGKFIQDGSHPAWKAIAAKWGSYHPLCCNGLEWGDANHFSITDGVYK